MSRYSDSLPAWLRRDPQLDKVLLAFERILDGADLPPGTPDPAEPGLARTVERLPAYLRPGPGLADAERAPAGFLPWLAGWVAVSLRDEWDDETRRRVIAGAVQLYRLRGTKEGLRRMLGLYAGLPEAATILEFEQVPHYFQVEVKLPSRDPAQVAGLDRSLRAIIDREKPAHTFYGLRFSINTMQLIPGLQLGVNTLLGSS